MVDWNELAIFVKVVQEGSFIAASRSLGVPRSTVSRKVASLEDRLGVRLLHRTTRSVAPTDEGRAFFERCAPLIREADLASRAVGDRQDQPAGRLRLAAPNVFGHHFLGPIVARFLRTWPEVRVELLITDRVVSLVEEGFDLAVRAGQLGDSNLIARKLGETRFEVVASPDYLQRHGVAGTVADLEEHDCIVVGEGNGPREWAFDVDGETVRVPVSGRVIVNALELARQGAIEGLGIARLPAFLVVKDLHTGRLVRVLDTDTPSGGGVFAVYPSRRHLSATVRAFVEMLQEELGGDLTSRLLQDRCAPFDAMAEVVGACREAEPRRSASQASP